MSILYIYIYIYIIRSEFPMVLVANKADLESDRVVSYHEGEELSRTLKVSKMTTPFLY